MIKCFRSKVALSLIVAVPLATVGLAQIAAAGPNDAELRDRDGALIRERLDMNSTITMKARDGSDVLYAEGPAYSPKQTCGACHDYTAINKAYHFMQGALPSTAVDNSSRNTAVNTKGMGVSDTWSGENQDGTAYKYLANAYGHLLSGGQFGAW